FFAQFFESAGAVFRYFGAEKGSVLTEVWFLAAGVVSAATELRSFAQFFESAAREWRFFRKGLRFAAQFLGPV
ncbi:MAG: hypothetical protein AB7P01_02805, partial [Bacteroidia bacterium]